MIFTTNTRSKDSKWAVKNGKTHFGYKLHTLHDVANDMIMNHATTKTSVYDSQMDLDILGIDKYREKGYLGVEGQVIDATKDKSLRGNTMSVESIHYNMGITKKRSRGERPYSVIKTIIHCSHVFITTIPR